MRIREIIFQGVLGCDSPVRLATAPGVDRMSLPSGLSAQDVHGLLLALFFPERVPSSLAQQLSSGSVKLAVVFEQDGKVYRLLRRSETSSLRLQLKESSGFSGLAKGREEAERALARTLGLPEFETFAAVNLWRFDDDELFAPVGGMAALGSRGKELVEKYRAAVRVEALEDRIKSIEGEIRGAARGAGEGRAHRGETRAGPREVRRAAIARALRR